MNIPIKIVYFAYLIPNKWRNIVIEQLDFLKNLDLYNIATDIYMSISGDDTDVNELKKLLTEKYEKVKTINIFNENLFEYPGIKTVYDISQDDKSLILYFHTKGMTSGSHIIRKTVSIWTIEWYERILQEFEKNENLDIICAIPHAVGFSYYNFFWVRSEFVKNYCTKPEIKESRYYWETWLSTGNRKERPTTIYSPIVGNYRVPKFDAAHINQIFNNHRKLL